MRGGNCAGLSPLRLQRRVRIRILYGVRNEADAERNIGSSGLTVAVWPRRTSFPSTSWVDDRTEWSGTATRPEIANPDKTLGRPIAHRSAGRPDGRQLTELRVCPLRLAADGGGLELAVSTVRVVVRQAGAGPVATGTISGGRAAAHTQRAAVRTVRHSVARGEATRALPQMWLVQGAQGDRRPRSSRRPSSVELVRTRIAIPYGSSPRHYLERIYVPEGDQASRLRLRLQGVSASLDPGNILMAA